MQRVAIVRRLFVCPLTAFDLIVYSAFSPGTARDLLGKSGRCNADGARERHLHKDNKYDPA
jgi:hypothetical protein